MLRKSPILLVYILILFKNINSSSINVIDVDDILSKNFMPSALLLLENTENAINMNETLESLPLVNGTQPFIGGFNDAMKTMTFHRSMMNQYLCRNFVANQIISEMTLPRIKRRMGNASPGTEDKSSKFNVNNRLLEDEGSKTYSDWLHKSTTLEDIYRHYNKPESRNDDEFDPDTSSKKEADDDDEQYDGQVTDYVYQHNPEIKYSKNKPKGNHALYYHHTGYYFPTSQQHEYPESEHNSYGDSGTYPDQDPSKYSSGHGVQDHDHVLYHSYPPKYHVHHHKSNDHGYDKANELTDLFEVALTALAYLSFGMFLVHLIMSISAVTNNSTSTAANMMMPMSMSPTATAADGSTGTGSTSTTMGSTAADTGPGTGTGTGGGTMMGAGTGGGTATGGGGMMGATGGGTDDTAPTGDAGSTGNGDMGGNGDMNPDGTEGGTATGGGGMMGATGGGTDDTAPTGDAGSTDNGDMGGTGDMNPDGGSDTGGGSTGGDGDSTGNGSTGTGDGTTGDGMSDTIKLRLRRQVPNLTNADNRALNELARRVLTSIEAALVANNDNGVCLRKSICENNKFSRSLEGRSKIFIPIWSLGMSWLSGRLVKNIYPTTSMLDGLKASMLGLGKADCQIIYQKCNLELEKSRRRKRK